ncbi:MAG TPA: AI-2E family transporter [Sphingomicrobium sp.]
MADNQRPPESPGPADLSSRSVREEARKAAVWLGMALAIVGVIVLAQPILLIIGGMVFAVILDGGARLLGRALPIGRIWRLVIVIAAGFTFIGWVLWFAGSTFVAQFEALRAVVTEQFDRVMAWADEMGFIQEGSAATVGQQVLGSVGRLTSAVSTALGALASGLLIIVIGIFIAIEPRLYDRGFAWMLPVERRAHFYEISDRVGFTLRRLMAGRIVGMIAEGLFTYVMLAHVGPLFGIAPIPMAALLGLITGLLAFIPNIGAIISGILMVAVGFSAGSNEGLWAIFVYFFVQNFDGYVVIPYIARKTVDLAPALVLAAQLIFGALFGFLGLLLADPIVATIKVALEKISQNSPKPEVRAAARRSSSPATKKKP